MTDTKCICGSEETPRHLLLYCRVYSEQRKTLFSKVKKLLNIRSITLLPLIYIKAGIEYTVVFLKETSISIRKWHINRIKSRGDHVT